MKKVLSIPLILLILVTGVNVNFATHYCHGYVAATKVSLTGELATCGMENTSPIHSSEISLSNDCCNDTLSIYSIDNNYTPSSSFIPELCQVLIQVYTVTNVITAVPSDVLNSQFTNESPPGALMSTSVDISAICVYLI